MNIIMIKQIAGLITFAAALAAVIAQAVTSKSALAVCAIIWGVLSVWLLLSSTKEDK